MGRMSMDPRFDVVVEGLAFPESPRWHGGRLWLVEKRAGRVIVIDDDQVRPIIDVPGQPGGLGWTLKGHLLVVAASEQRLLRLVDGRLEEMADLRALTVGRCNDMIVDRHGRAYVGHFGYDLLGGARASPATLVLVQPDGTARPVADELAFPNGCAITPDGRTLIVAESGANRLTAFTIGDDGALGNRRTFASLGPVVPDGIALDGEGAIWVADPVGCQIVRVHEGGEMSQTVSTAPQGAFACALGSDDGRTLFVCLYTEEASQQAVDAPPIGTLVATRVGVPAAEMSSTAGEALEVD